MAQKLKFGNGTWATKKGSTLAYNDEDNNFKPLPFSFERDSIATRVNKEGLIEVVGNDIPRIDYTDSAKGALLLEPQRTNLIQWSDLFSASSTGGYYGLYWNAIITDNNAISPDGSLNASKVVRGTDDVLIRALGVVTVSTENTTTLWAKKGNYDKIMLDIGDEAASTITLTDEWQRIETTTSSALNTHIDISMPNSASGDYIYIYGFQLEAGSYATSLINTQGSAVTRVADTANGAGNSEVFNDSEGVLFADISALANDLTNRTIGVLGDSNNLIELAYRNTSNQVRCLIKSSGVVEVNIQHILSDITLNNKLAVKYKSNNTSLYVNGFEVATGLSANMPSGLNKLNFNRFDGAEEFYGKTKQLQYYNSVLTDLELETLTSYRSLNELVTELNLNTL